MLQWSSCYKMQQFITEESQPVMVTDAGVSSHPIIVNVNKPDEINEVFDAISYSKVWVHSIMITNLNYIISAHVSIYARVNLCLSPILFSLSVRVRLYARMCDRAMSSGRCSVFARRGYLLGKKICPQFSLIKFLSKRVTSCKQCLLQVPK